MNTKLISALRITANSILSGHFSYSWASNTRCNCGALACVLMDKSPVELKGLIQDISKNVPNTTPNPGSWTNLTSFNCPVTGFSGHEVFQAFKSAGLTRDDMHDLEYLKNKKVLLRMKKRTASIRSFWGKESLIELPVDYSEGVDVANYMLAWAEMMVEDGTGLNESVVAEDLSLK